MFEGLKILYLEDEPLVALDTSDHLESLGFEMVEVAYRLSQAEDAINVIDFDIALLDINVDRGQTSLDLGETLLQKGVRVVFASGNSQASTDVRKKGCHFLDKPFILDDLTKTLRAAANTP